MVPRRWQAPAFPGKATPERTGSRKVGAEELVTARIQRRAEFKSECPKRNRAACSAVRNMKLLKWAWSRGRKNTPSTSGKGATSSHRETSGTIAVSSGSLRSLLAAPLIGRRWQVTPGVLLLGCVYGRGDLRSRLAVRAPNNIEHHASRAGSIPCHDGLYVRFSRRELTLFTAFLAF